MENKVNNILDFMKELEKVCLVKRATLLSDGTPETDSSHSFKLAFLVMLVYPYLKHTYDYTKMLELALAHDIVEGVTGDLPQAVQRANPQIKEQKQKSEQEAIEYYKSLLPEPLNNKIYDLFMEYEARQTPESKLVAVLDKLDANLQANRHKNGDVRYWADCENGAEYYKMAVAKKQIVADLDEPIISVLEEKIIMLAKENIAKCQTRI